MSDLTPAQMQKKQEVEAQGKVFISPSQYKEMMMAKAKPKYSKGAVKTNPGSIASYSARKMYKKDFAEISPDTDLLIDQMLNPDGCNEITRWPNTYGLSAVYKCNTIINPKFSANRKSCVVVHPSVRDAIMTTAGAQTAQNLYPWGTTIIPGTSEATANPYSEQTFDLSNDQDSAYWSSPIVLNNREAVLPFPNSQTSALLYPIQWEMPETATQPIQLCVVFPEAITSQAVVTVNLYDATYTSIYENSVADGTIGSIGDPNGIGVRLDIIEAGSAVATDAVYFSCLVTGTSVPYYGSVYLFFDQSSEATGELQSEIVIPNHEQHVIIQDIKDADTIDNSADQAFVLSQSTLITSNFSDLQNGGVIAIARIPGMAVVGGQGDGIDANGWYDWISSLSYNQYDGAVKKGAYAWYLPEDETGFFYGPISTYAARKLPYVVSEFTTTDPDPNALGIRLKITTIVQFTTTSAVYDCRPSAHVSETAFMHHILSLVQASYSNDGHINGLKGALKKVGNSVVKLLKNPKTYSTAAELIGGLAV